MFDKHRRFLITTALEETWRDGEPVLFLGEWCRLFSRRDRWQKMDAEVLPYHWDDRAKLDRDYHYLQGFYERVLADLARELNRIHDVDHGNRYWRILIGPWLGYFLQMVFDRWTSIQEAIQRYDLSGTVILQGREETLIPNDMAGFLALCIRDEWNHHLYAAILGSGSMVPGIERPRRPQPPVTRPTSTPAAGIRHLLAASCAGALRLFARENDAVLLATYLPRLDELKLQWRLGQVPQRWSTKAPTAIAPRWDARQWTISGESQAGFEAVARALLPTQIPTAYLEGYKTLAADAEAAPFPRRPKLIWSSNSFSSDDVFKVWAADKAEQGSPIVAGQHGGGYGIARWLFVEEHEIAISDRYLTWGWSIPGQSKPTPVGQLRCKRPLGIRHQDQAGALLVTNLVPRQSHHLHSCTIARQWLDYFEDQCTFIERLPGGIRDALTVRLWPTDWGWDQAARFRARFPSLRVDDGHADINRLVRQSRLYISTYNATTFLESFTMNVPTVIFWNPNHWELRDSAEPYFAELAQIGIFHRRPEDAARHVAAIWEDVDSWWHSPHVQEVVVAFSRRFCHLPDDILNRVEETLRNVIAESGPAAQRHAGNEDHLGRQRGDGRE